MNSVQPAFGPVIYGLRRRLYVALVFMSVLGIAHAAFGDVWGSLVNILFSTVGYMTFQTWSYQSISLFVLLCLFNFVGNLTSSISLGMAVYYEQSGKGNPDPAEIPSDGTITANLLIAYFAVSVLDSMATGACLVLAQLIYAKIAVIPRFGFPTGMLHEPLMGSDTSAMSGLAEHARARPQSDRPPGFVPFSGRPYRMGEDDAGSDGSAEQSAKV